MTLQESWKQLIEFYSPRNEPTSEFVKAWKEALEEFSPDIIADMTKWLKFHDRTYRPFPSIQDCVGVADSIQSQRQVESAEKEQVIGNRAKADAEKFFDRKVKGFVGQCKEAMFSYLAGSLTKTEYHERLKEIPGFDFELFLDCQENRTQNTVQVQTFSEGELVPNGQGYVYRYAVRDLYIYDKAMREMLTQHKISYIYRRKQLNVRPR